VIDLRSWPKKWNDEATLSRLVRLPEHSAVSPWALLGVFAIGLIAGAALGGYALSPRSPFRRFGPGTDWMEDQGTEPVSVTTHRSNHRQKATSEVR
jgi:hypothetical protein